MNLDFVYKCRSVTTSMCITFILILMGITAFTKDSPKVVHVFVALCDNENQGIIPVPDHLGNGNDPGNNLYWGALYGVKTYFRQSKNWELIKCLKNRENIILESCVFKLKNHDVYLVADAYKGMNIKQAITDFIESSGCNNLDTLSIDKLRLPIAGNADLVSYVGHNGLMEFNLDSIPRPNSDCNKDAIILACASRYYFSPAFINNNANTILWTTNLMAPEAYTLEAAVYGWALNENSQQIVNRAASAYVKYQKCSIKSAKNLLVSGYEKEND